MTHVLPVAAFELGHPVAFVVLSEASDAALHACRAQGGSEDPQPR
jgi:hypothetical protein